MTKGFLRTVLGTLIFVGALPHFAAPVLAEETSTSGDVLIGEGISGYSDRKHRNPTVSVRTVTKSAGVQILADGYVRDDAFKEAPLRFDFYINRRFFTSQLRTVELPGAVGVDIGPDIAVPPFNYSVVATVLHPNRTFTTIVQGAVYPSDLVAQFDCQVTVTDLEGSMAVYELSEASTSQADSDTLALTLDNATTTPADDTEEAESVDASLSLDVTDETTAQGTLLLTSGDATATHDVTGTLSKSDGRLTGLEVSNGDGTVLLSCGTGGSTNEAAAE